MLKKALLFKALAYILLITPMIALLVVKKDEYFIEGEQVKLSLGCILTLIFTFAALKGKLRDINPIVTLGIIWILVYLMQTLVDDLLIIIPCCMAGNLFYLVFNKFYNYYYEIYKVQRNAKIDQTARNKINITENNNEDDNLLIDSGRV